MPDDVTRELAHGGWQAIEVNVPCLPEPELDVRSLGLQSFGEIINGVRARPVGQLRDHLGQRRYPKIVLCAKSAAINTT
jgi:hypothetical protein